MNNKQNMPASSSGKRSAGGGWIAGYYLSWEHPGDPVEFSKAKNAANI